MEKIEINWEEVLQEVLRIVDKSLRYGIEHIPVIESFIIDKLDAMFAPRQIIRQLGMILAIQVSLMTYNSLYQVTSSTLSLLTSKGRKRKQLLDQIHNAATFAEWRKIATRLDDLNGNSRWREAEDNTLCDIRMIKRRINSTLDMLERGDVFDLMFRIRGGLARDQFGIQHEGLFTKALAGPKLIIERYHETMSMALNYICDSAISEEEIPTDAKLAFFNETRHSYGRTALLLSGGAYLGYYHMGVIKALFREGLMPRVISGASAGSIITAVLGCRTEQELSDLIDTTEGGTATDRLRTDFFRYSEELKSEVARRLNYLVPQALRWLTFPLFSSIFDKKILNLDTEHFKKSLMHNIGLYTFQEAFDRTGRIINITVAPLNHYDPPRLLNYLTAPHVCVWSAAAASCALPGIFDSVSLIVKEPNGQFRPENEWTRQALLDKEEVKMAKLAAYSDGSLENDLPMQQLSELFNVNHFIVSQVNPHSAILSSLAMKATVWSHPVYGAIVGYLRFLTAQCRDWLKNIVDFFIFRSKSPVWSARRGLTQTLTQDYEGRENDITIMPWVGHISAVTALMLAIRNPTDEEFDEVVRAAERNTFPMIPRIKAHCLIETTLDKCVQRLRKRLTDETTEAKEKEYANYLKAQQQAIQEGGEVNFGQFGRRMDRTPSFYTVRSIVNLSGLSVSDPLTVPLPVPSHTQPLPQHHHNSYDNTNGTPASASSLQGVFPPAVSVVTDPQQLFATNPASRTSTPSAGNTNNETASSTSTSSGATDAASSTLVHSPQPVLVTPRPVYGRRHSGRIAATPPPATVMTGMYPHHMQHHRPMSMPTPPPAVHMLSQRSRSNSISGRQYVNQAGYYDINSDAYEDMAGYDMDMAHSRDYFPPPGATYDGMYYGIPPSQVAPQGPDDFWRTVGITETPVNAYTTSSSMLSERSPSARAHSSRESLDGSSNGSVAGNGGKKDDITKTTHMADFYYRRGHSSDKLTDLK